MQICKIFNFHQELLNYPFLIILSFFFFLNSLIYGQIYTHDWTDWPIEAEYFVNSNVSLKCGVRTNVSNFFVIWTKIIDANDAKTLFYGLDKVDAPPNYFIRSLPDNTGTQLDIYNFSRIDDAVFKCFITSFGIHKSANISATGFPGEPSILCSVTDDFLEENIPIQLYCVSSGGNPKHLIKFSWFKNGLPILQNIVTFQPLIKFDLFNSTLAWKFSRDDFLANFSCKVEHLSFPRSQIIKTRQFQFKYGPIISFNVVNPLSIFSNRDLNLHCLVDSFPPIDNSFILWTNNLNKASKGLILSLRNVTKFESGNYTCAATSNKKTQTSRFYLNVLYAPLLSASLYLLQVAEGKSVNITMMIDANPAINSSIIWRKNADILTNPNYILESNQVTLMLQGVTRNDEGDYKLHVFNVMVNSEGSVIYGNSSSLVRLDVLFKPGAATVILLGGSAVVNENVALNCLVNDLDNRTTIKYRWISSLGLNVSQFSQNYYIPRISLDYIGTYSCWAENSVGVGTIGSYNLNVIVPPVWMYPFLLANSTAKLSDTPETLICVLNSRPVVHVIWYHEGQVISGSEESPYSIYEESNTSSLVAKTTSKLTWKANYSPEDYGFYLCKADNISQEFKLILKFAPTSKNLSPTISGDPDQGAVITANFLSYPRSEYKWYKNLVEIQNDGVKYMMARSSMTETNDSSLLQISQLSLADEANYTCEAANEIATTKSTFRLFTFPAPPTRLILNSSTWESVLLSWQPSENSGKVKNYIISYYVQNSTRKRSVVNNRRDISVGNVLLYNLTDLYPNLTYVTEIVGENRLGKSPPSQPFIFATPSLLIPEPLNVIYDRSVNQLTATIDNRTLEPVCISWNQVPDCELCVGTRTIKVDSDLGTDVRVRCCLMRRKDVCSNDVKANIVEANEASHGLPVRDIIILVCVLGGIFLLLLIAIIICCCCCRQKSDSKGTQIDWPPLENPTFENDGLDLSYNSDAKPKSELSYPDKVYNLDDYSDAGDSGVSQTPRASRRVVYEVVV